MPAWLFKRQGTEGEEANLCAYFALYHFRNGRLTMEEYLEKSARFFRDEFEMEAEDAVKFVKSSGNDPRLLSAAFGLHAIVKSNIAKYYVLIVCDTSKIPGHFYTIRRIDGEWWDYDSYNRDAPRKIGDDSAALLQTFSLKLYGG